METDTGPREWRGTARFVRPPRIRSVRPDWLAGEPGFEPRLTESESDRLPRLLNGLAVKGGSAASLLWFPRSRIRSPASAGYRAAISWCAGHAQQLGGESPPPNLMEVKS